MFSFFLLNYLQLLNYDGQVLYRSSSSSLLSFFSGHVAYSTSWDDSISSFSEDSGCSVSVSESDSDSCCECIQPNESELASRRATLSILALLNITTLGFISASMDGGLSPLGLLTRMLFLRKELLKCVFYITKNDSKK